VPHRERGDKPSRVSNETSPPGTEIGWHGFCRTVNGGNAAVRQISDETWPVGTEIAG
jgi:hypothetical protein